MVDYDRELRREFSELNRNILSLTRVLTRLLAEHRYQNIMFRKAYNLSAKDVSEANEAFKEEWK